MVGSYNYATSVSGSKLDAFLDYFIPARIRVQPDAHRRARMFMLSHVFGPFLGNVIPLYLFVMGMDRDYRFWTFTISITAFWAYPILLKITEQYMVLAFLSVQNLLFCILWACFSYGGIFSPFLPWILITPMLAFFYLPSHGRVRDALLLLIVANVTVFATATIAEYHLPVVDLAQFQIIGIVSTISASIYVAMMSLYFARVLKEQQRFEREVGDLVSTTENLETLTTAAHHATSAKADFVASMSHELRTPLNAVLGYSQLMLEDARDDGNHAIIGDLENIHGAGAHLLCLVNDILDYSKIEAGKMPVYLAVDDLDLRLQEIARVTRPVLEARGYTLQVSVEGASMLFQTDWSALSKAINHILLGSALAPGGGTLFVVGSIAQDESCRIRITDPDGVADGRPIATLFDIFHDDRDVGPTKYGGAGIGLALGQHFVQLIGGHITLAHDASGARIFTLKLPPSSVVPAELAMAS